MEETKQNTEVEAKFSLAADVNEELLVNQIKEIFAKQGWKIKSERNDQRSYLYYDTPDFKFYKNEETVRRVGGFDSKTNNSGFRYDHKSGKIDCRIEKKYWDKRVISPEEIIQKLNLKFKGIIPMIPAETYHKILDIEKEDTLIEVKIDKFDLLNGIFLREIELEVMQGNQDSLWNLSEVIQSELNLKECKKQKYSQIVESLNLLIERRYKENGNREKISN
jgi:inorganic triphosphatase YgiF